jgi:hypothetical protein
MTRIPTAAPIVPNIVTPPAAIAASNGAAKNGPANASAVKMVAADTVFDTSPKREYGFISLFL